ncbi:hypothetical protein, partial [Pseudoalteromonas sp. AC40-MNA-CIBAN-0181]|uniref:hypothetical protein n=1 Tax=Pseudoalteromonas sp. AC40-MNA-CIBAN-0181 TaxID=3140452 RepID=UPI003329AF6F
MSLILFFANDILAKLHSSNINEDITMPLALWALTLSAFAIGTTEFVIVGLVPKGSPKIIIKFQSHHSHPYFSNRVAL